MPVVSVREIWDGAGSTIDVQSKQKRDYRRVFAVTTDSMRDGSVTVRAAVPVVPFEVYTDPNGVHDPFGAYASRIEDRRTEDPFEWIVVVYFSNRTDDPNLGKADPTQRAPEVEWFTEQFQRAAEADSDGSAYTNSADKRFDPPVELDDSRLGLRVVRIEPTFDPLISVLYKDVVNSDVFLGFAAGCAKAKAPTSRRHFENGVYYFEVTYVFNFNLDGWNQGRLDKGPTYRKDDGSEAKFTTLYAEPIEGLLNGEGGPLNGKGGVVTQKDTKLANPASATATKITLADAPFLPTRPSTGPYYVKADGEVMQVVGGIGSLTLTVKRGQRGTTRVNHIPGAFVIQLPYFAPFKDYPQKKFAVLQISGV